MKRKRENMVDVISLTSREVHELGKNLRRQLIDGRQWLVSMQVGEGAFPEMKTCSSFDGASRMAKEYMQSGTSIRARIDSIRYFLKILNGVSQKPFDGPGKMRFKEIAAQYPAVQTPLRALFSQPFLLDDFFPVIHPQAFSFMDSQATIRLLRVKESQLVNKQLVKKGGVRCTDILEGLHLIEDIASGRVAREPGETYLLVGETVAGGRNLDAVILYKIAPGKSMERRIRLPIEQLVDPTQDYFELRLLFAKFDRQLEKLFFFDQHLKRTPNLSGTGLDGLEFWSPRPLYLKVT